MHCVLLPLVCAQDLGEFSKVVMGVLEWIGDDSRIRRYVSTNHSFAITLAHLLGILRATRVSKERYSEDSRDLVVPKTILYYYRTRTSTHPQPKAVFHLVVSMD